MNYIFKKRLKHCTKEFIKIMQIIAVALIFILGIILIKYKPLYKVEINNKEIGYVKNKKEFECIINEYTQIKDENVAFVELNSKPEYELKLVPTNKQTNEEEILETIKEDVVTTYTAFGIIVNDDIKTYVSTAEEAEAIVNSIKEQYSKDISEGDIAIKQIFTQESIKVNESETAIQTVAKVFDLKKEVENKQKEELQKQKEKQEAQKQEENKNVVAVVNGVSISCKPVSGTITSRFGEVSRVRSSSHTGLDIAASTGTPIKAVASGTVTFAETKGSYGKLIKIKHENGVETWYGHCSKLYVTAGQKVSAGETIAAVGSTGNSTGSHLHLEIRVNGTAVNPQKYLYK